MSKFLWAEEVNTSIYLLNRLPTKSVHGNTPIEAWFGEIPSIKNLKIFGFMCYFNDSSVRRGKLDEKVKKRVFIRYATKANDYRVYSLSGMKIEISSDVHFDENSYWD